MQDEKELVRRAQQRDEVAFSRLYESYFDKIYRYVAFKIGDRTEAEDVTQQVFVKVLKAIATFRWQGLPFSAWLFRIAHNQVVDYLRKKMKQTTVTLDRPLQDNSVDPQRAVEQKLEMERVSSAAKRLTQAQQQVLSLRFAGELSVAEAAQVMGRSQGAVKALQHSAIKALRKILVESEDEERPGI